MATRVWPEIQSDSLRLLIESRADERRDAPYLLAARSRKTLSYGQLGAASGAWRGYLGRAEIPPNARLGIRLSDPVEFATAFLSIVAAGYWAAPLEPTANDGHDERLRDAVDRLRLDAVVSDREPAESAGVAWIDASRARVEAAPSSTALDTKFDSDDGGGVILASSGTTGTPKVMALTIHQLLTTASWVAQNNELNELDRGFNPLPLWHINAEVVGVLASLVAGASLVLDDRFHRTDFWDLMGSFGVTWINAVPAIVARLAELGEDERVPSGVRFIRSASAPLSPTVASRFEASTHIAIIESYGMTEAASQICVNPLREPRRPGSVGRAVGVEVRITSMTDLVAPDFDAPDAIGAGVVGHVEIRGPSVIRRYDARGYDDRFDAQGWLRTGDVGYLDDDGFLFLIGRSDDVINRGGEKVFPREIEESLADVKDLRSAAVVGAPDEVFGEVPVIYVELDVVAAASPERMSEIVSEIGDVLVERFPRSRRPAMLHVVEQMPTHVTGKIQRSKLRTPNVKVLLSQSVGGRG